MNTNQSSHTASTETTSAASPRPKTRSKRVTFRLNAPQASEVLLAASFTKWQEKARKMKQLKNGDWTLRAQLREGTRCHYRFIVDGEWKNDPSSALSEPNPFGTENSVLVVE